MRERNLFEAAEAIEESKMARPAPVKVSDALRYRGMTPAEIATERHQERVRSAAAIVSAAIDDPHSRPAYLDSNAVNELLADLKAVKDEPPIYPVGPHPAADPDVVEPGLDHPAAP
jgi:hypothetical protein